MNLTKEQAAINYQNRKAAAEFFNLKSGQVLHHINPDWKHNDIDRYIQWNPNDLVVMTRAEHASLHQKGKHKGPFTEEHRKRLAESHTGYIMPESQRSNMSRAHSKKVQCIETGIIYNSAKEARELTGIKSQICLACTGKYKMAGGYHWKYLED